MAIIAKKEQPAKAAAIKELKESFSPASDFIFTDYRGLSVAQITELRNQLRPKGSAFKVVKNNFARIAFKELERPDVSAYLTGPTAVAIAMKDSNEIAKILFDFARENSKDKPVLQVKGALIGTSIYDENQVAAFSRLPGKKELISMLLSCMQAPVRNLAGCLNDIPSRLVRTLKAVADKKEAA